jgi:hypothetical protein
LANLAMTEGIDMQKLTIMSATVAVVFVAALAATAFGRNTNAERIQVSDGTDVVMPTIEQLTLSADKLPIQYYHPI